MPHLLLTPAKMRRLAAALVAEPPGEERWVVMTQDAPHIVVGVYPTDQRATDALHSAHPVRPAAIFGPYVNEGEPPLSGIAISTVGWDGNLHIRPTEWLYPPPSLLDEIRSTFSGLSIRDPLTGTTTPGAQIDAIFLGEAAVRTFVLPHLVEVHGLGGALRYLAERGATR